MIDFHNRFCKHVCEVDTTRHPMLQSMALTSNERMGWIPDLPDHRDLHMTFKSVEAPKEKNSDGERSFVTKLLQCDLGWFQFF